VSIERKQLESARRILSHVADTLDIPFSVRLWDGSRAPLGRDPHQQFFLLIDGPRTVTTLLREPTLENVVRHYAEGKLDLAGGDLFSMMDYLRKHDPKKKVKRLKKSLILREALPFLFGSTEKLKTKHTFSKDETGLHRKQADNSDYIRFHYDVGNDFYRLFLDEEMQYSCAYFKKPENSLDQAQRDKLEHICRKLRLKKGESLLDIGSGWGGLICYAAKHYGVRAHGVTLSHEQHRWTLDKADREGLKDRVTVELTDYQNLKGSYDKIASVGMFEHVGRKNIPAYFSKMNSLLNDRGLMLHHAITRRAKGDSKKFDKIGPGRELIQKFIFPGFEMDHIGNTLTQMEVAGFEVRDVESLREHYALTLQHWARQLEAHREEAVRLVGSEKYRLWLAYLAGVSFVFADGNLAIHQTLAQKRVKGPSGLPWTREDLYR